MSANNFEEYTALIRYLSHLVDSTKTTKYQLIYPIHRNT